MKVFVCEDTLEGIFTGVYDGWASRAGHENVRLVTKVEEYELFCEYIDVKTDVEKAEKVLRTVVRRMGSETYEALYRAVCSCDEGKADAVYHTIADGLSLKDGRMVLHHISNPYVEKIFALNRTVANEAHRWIEFLRFKELENGVLFSEIGSQNRVLTILAPHFADRFVNENFVIYDSIHRDSVVHEKQKNWVLVERKELDAAFRERFSEAELFYQELFTDFCHTISIKERENRRLQMQMLPLKFQNYMTEFCHDS